MNTRYGPSGGTWTHGLLTPSQARYQLRHTRLFKHWLVEVSLYILAWYFLKCNPQNKIFVLFYELLFFLNFKNQCWQSVPEYDIILQVFGGGRCFSSMERCPSGWRNRSWKPATRKRPWVRIPLSPPFFHKHHRPAEVPKRPKGLPC